MSLLMWEHARKNLKPGESPVFFKCPSCKSKLSRGSNKRLSGIEDICSNEGQMYATFKCKHEGCPCNDTVFWNDNGELYTVHGAFDKRPKESDYIDENNAPFGSETRQYNVELHKSDENGYIYRSKLFCIYKQYWYRSNTNGDILKRKCKLEIHVYNEHGGLERHITQLSRFIFSCKQFHRKRKYMGESILKELSERKDWPRADPYRKWIYRYALVWEYLFGKPKPLEGSK